MISLKMIDFDKKCLRMWEIWAMQLLPKALKTCPKSKKLPNQVALAVAHTHYWEKVFLALITF